MVVKWVYTCTWHQKLGIGINGSIFLPSSVSWQIISDQEMMRPLDNFCWLGVGTSTSSEPLTLLVGQQEGHTACKKSSSGCSLMFLGYSTQPAVANKYIC